MVYLRQNYVGYALDFWKRVIWCDVVFVSEIGKNSRLIRVWRRALGEFESDCLAPTIRSGRMSVMIWAAISWQMKSELSSWRVATELLTD